MLSQYARALHPNDCQLLGDNPYVQQSALSDGIYSHRLLAEFFDQEAHL